MDTKDILQAADSTKRLVQNEEYYKYIFKKTEKIVSVVFYILHNVEASPRDASHIADIEEAARAAHNAILESLETRTHVAEDVIRASAHALIALESKLRVAHLSGLIAPDVMHVLSNEIDSVLRGMNKFLRSANAFDDTDYQIMGSFSENSGPERRRVRKQQPSGNTLSAGEGARPAANSTSALDRRERIKTVLEAKGQANIKDIAAIITDCSEKTIQRELNAMIEDNVVKRHGERRWSTYSLF
ncbi:hypothetical protein H6783_01920 [Candidatus Nomurabacteria bacterium]|nr:hypothetical protein [Candidatus Nomurabacteria bacterium]